MNGRRIHLAWIIILASFFVCVGLIVAIPIGTGSLVQESTRSLDVTVQANQGTVGVRQTDGEPVAIFAGDLPLSLNPSGSILTNATDTALLLFHLPDVEQTIARLQIYGNTNVSLQNATTPRFETSSAEHRIALSLDNGRIQLTVPPQEERPVYVEMITPQGKIDVRETGQYSITANNVETQLAVLHGRAVAEQGEENLSLETDQRAVLPSNGPPRGPLDTERNLVSNGDFTRNFDEWVLLAPNVEIADQSTVEVGVNNSVDEPGVRFRRVGLGHADAGLRQIINEDVTDFESLQLLISMDVSEQSLGVCGERGSECPLIVRIDYVDVNGVDQTWQQGFYTVGDISPGTPDVCVACAPPLNEHQRVPFDQLVFYESENLIENLGQLDILPRQVKSITLIASGHTFDTQVVDVALLARE
jgi:hypothetical protein